MATRSKSLRSLAAACVALGALAGCSAVLGIQDVTGGDGGASSDASFHEASFHDTGAKKDTGVKGDTGTGKDSGAETGAAKDSGGDTGTAKDGGADAGGVLIASGIREIIGITSDDLLVFNDSQGGISVSTAAGAVTQIAGGPTTDGGPPPVCVGLGGTIVSVLTDYTTTGQYVGTLSIWSSALKSLKQVATQSLGTLRTAADSSYVVYIDAANTNGTTGKIGVVKGDGTGAQDITSTVVTDESSVTCAVFALIDKGYVVTTTCATTSGPPEVTSFDSTSSFVGTVLEMYAGASSVFVPPFALNFTTDTAGFNVLTVNKDGPALNVQAIAGSGAQNLLLNPFGAADGGTEFFYLSTDSTFALFSEPSGDLGKATLATPSSTPSIGTIGSALGVQLISPDEQYDIDYDAPRDSMTGAPGDLTLRKISTGVPTPLVPLNAGNSATGTGFTADSSYALFFDGLVSVGGFNNVGALKSANVTSGSINTILAQPGAFSAASLTGTKIIYNQKYVPSGIPTLPNGAASADIYLADAASSSPGTLLIAGADAAGTFYVTKNKTHLFYSISKGTMGDGGLVPATGDGIYSVEIPQ
jgi:hypothetical protein